MTTETSSLLIGARFAGPPSSANGGYTAGLVAERVAHAPHLPVTVTLRRPPPLETPLHVTNEPSPPSPATTADAAVRLLDGDVVVAEAVPGELHAEAVEPVPLTEAMRAHASYRGLVEHPFPACFVCGPDRVDGDGLRLSPGLLGPGRTACVWTPHSSLAGHRDEVAPRFVWAALDCPGGWTSDLDARPLVLGRMTALCEAPVSPGRPYVVVARLLAEEGRKTFTVSTVYDEDGRVVGRAEHIWIAVDPARFR